MADVVRDAAGKVKQATQDLAPVDGGSGGFVGAETGPALGLTMVTGKNGYVQDHSVWGETSSFTGTTDNTGSIGNVPSFGGQDSTDEYAGYKRIQTDEGLPQTFRTSAGAGDAGPAGSDEGDSRMKGAGDPMTQSVPDASAGEHTLSDMPQTEVTKSSGGGAPLWKR